jgi:hypothetical protein
VALASDANTFDMAETTSATDFGPGATVEDVGDALLLRFCSHVTAEIAAATTAEVARRLRRRDRPTVIIADLTAVQSFDLKAPIAAVREAVAVTPMIERVEIIAERRIVRVASVSAARILGLRCVSRIRSPR